MENIKKRLFSSQATQRVSTAGLSVIPIAAHPVRLQPNISVPPVPHPTPYHSLAILASSRGLLIRPVLGDNTESTSLLCIEWGPSGTIQELPCDCKENNLSESDWSNAAIVYGVLGCLRLFAGTLVSLARRKDRI